MIVCVFHCCVKCISGFSSCAGFYVKFSVTSLVSKGVWKMENLFRFRLKN